ncbi:MAG: aminotransferase class V-fold PLP-dependent enzyme [Actinobacteria bacterium]|nr:aminotransferase class V-fold PLP-dependent enzyme [Actinomycetota bacterium]
MDGSVETVSDETVYLDAASGVPLHPVAREAIMAAQADGWADPGRLYAVGRRAAILLASAREAVADVLDARPDEISFTSSGLTALHAAVLGTMRGNRRRGSRFVHSAVEHSAVLHAAEWHVAAGGEAEAVPVDHLARVDVDTFVARARAASVAAAALQAANHEVGTAQPVSAVADRLGDVPLIVDATQTLGHTPAPCGWSVLAADARQWGGPAGVGVLAVRTGTRWVSPAPADDHGRVPGPPDIPAVVGAAAALRAVVREQSATASRLSALIDRIRARVPAGIPDVEVLGDPVDRLPHMVTFSFLYVDGESLLLELDRRGFAVSSGSSCTSSSLEPSHVLVAMGALTSGNVRVSLSRDTTVEQVERFLDALPDAVANVRAQLDAPS